MGRTWLQGKFQVLEERLIPVASRTPYSTWDGFWEQHQRTGRWSYFFRRLAYPNRWIDLCKTFGRCPSDLCVIFYGILNHIYDNFSHLITDLNALLWLGQEYLRQYSDCISLKGSPLDNGGSLMELRDHAVDLAYIKMSCSADIRGFIDLSSNLSCVLTVWLQTCSDL